MKPVSKALHSGWLSRLHVCVCGGGGRWNGLGQVFPLVGLVGHLSSKKKISSRPECFNHLSNPLSSSSKAVQGLEIVVLFSLDWFQMSHVEQMTWMNHAGATQYTAKEGQVAGCVPCKHYIAPCSRMKLIM